MYSIKVPSTIEMGSHSYQVIFDSAQDDREFRGTFSDRKHKIFLSTCLHSQQLRVTFVHELIHLICELNDVRPPEQDINRFAEGVSELLFRNFDIDFDFSTVPILERIEKDVDK